MYDRDNRNVILLTGVSAILEFYDLCVIVNKQNNVMLLMLT